MKNMKTCELSKTGAYFVKLGPSLREEIVFFSWPTLTIFRIGYGEPFTLDEFAGNQWPDAVWQGPIKVPNLSPAR